MSHILGPSVLSAFWTGPFCLAAEAIVGLVTLSGAFDMEMREICWVTTTEKYGDSFFRSYVFRTWKDLYDILVAKVPCSLQLGALFPSHFITEAVPVTPYPPIRRKARDKKTGEMKEMEITIAQEPPREFERKSFRHPVLDLVEPEMRQENVSLHTPGGEIVLDVDLDCDKKQGEPQYDREGICGCGKKKQICDVCAEIFLDTAQRVINYLLTEVYQLKAFFWVFSGRRGLHCWILDKRVHRMTNMQRETFIKRIMDMNGGRVKDDVADHIYEAFLKPVMDKYPIFRQRQAQKKHSSARETAFLELFPKLDVAVSIDASHLRKLPLTLHPATGNLCVVVGHVDDPRYKFKYSEDGTIHATQIRDEHMKVGAIRIKEALAKI